MGWDGNECLGATTAEPRAVQNGLWKTRRARLSFPVSPPSFIITTGFPSSPHPSSFPSFLFSLLRLSSRIARRLEPPLLPGFLVSASDSYRLRLSNFSPSSLARCTVCVARALPHPFHLSQLLVRFSSPIFADMATEYDNENGRYDGMSSCFHPS